jgi:thioesterase domain-containing protein
VPDVRDTLVPIRPSGARNPLYCVHPISGSAYSYGGLVRLLDPEVPVHAFEAPGFDNDQRPATVLEELSTAYVQALRDANAEGPYCLLGWSMGGVIAFDMALRLAADGAQVPALVLVDAPAPERTQLPSSTDQVRAFMHDLVAAAGIPAAGLSEIFERRDDEASPTSLLEQVERTGILPEELDLEFLLRRFSIFQAHLKALFSYAAPGLYDGPVTVIRADQSPYRYMDWHTVASDVETHDVPGDHHSIWTGDRLRALADIVQRRLDATLTGVP